MTKQNAAALAELFNAFSDGTRLKLLMALRGGEHNVSTLRKRLKLPQSTVSHHLGLLRGYGLVQDRRKGKEIFYSVDPAVPGEVRRAVKILFG